MNNTSELIKKQIDSISTLRDLPSSEDPKFKAWLQLTKAIILKRLGGKKWQDFDVSCSFWPNRVGPWSEEELKLALNEGLDSAKSFLETLLQEIGIFGDESHDSGTGDLPNSKALPKLKFGEGGKPGQPGGGGSIFIQTEHFNITGGGKISADGGNYVAHLSEFTNLGSISINQTIAKTVNNITKLTQLVSQSSLNENEKRQLIGDIETIKAQIIKPTPDKSILQKAWSAIQTASDISGAAQLLEMIGQIVLPLLK